MITQLNPPLPLETSKGPGFAHFVIDSGVEADLLWVVFLDENGACWSIPNQEVQLQANWSFRTAWSPSACNPRRNVPIVKGETTE